MTLANALQEFQSSAAQCGSLIANAHRLDPAGVPILPLIDRKQITIAAFLNLFIGWETFLEDAVSKLMSGSLTIQGNAPIRFATPSTPESARKMLIGTLRFFDYGNHENVRKMVSIYFDRGYPFEPHFSAIMGELTDIRIMRNASAHITSTTQSALDALAQRILTIPQIGTDLYGLLLTIDPRSQTGGTVFSECSSKLLVTAQLIANG